MREEYNYFTNYTKIGHLYHKYLERERGRGRGILVQKFNILESRTMMADVSLTFYEHQQQLYCILTTQLVSDQKYESIPC